MKRITMVIAGLGGRGHDIYGNYAMEHPDEVEIAAVADPRPERLELAQREWNIPAERCFATAEELFAQPQLADAAVIATQDRQHVVHAEAALKGGYHLLLEKPVAVDIEGCLEVLRLARRYQRHVVVCHVLRYTPFYNAIKRIIEDGRIGEVVTIQAMEQVGYWHQAHSYVRGNWRRADESSPMILAKCCHDMDILLWMTDSHCTKVSSFGSLGHFRVESAPEGAPEFCLDGCPLAESCPYDAERIYLRDKGVHVPVIRKVVSLENTDDSVREALRSGPYGRCVYHCDNDVVDHQVVNLEFENGVTASFTMCAFTWEGSRTVKIMGALGQITGDVEENEIQVVSFATGNKTVYRLNTDAAGHSGGDAGFMRDVVRQMQTDGAYAGRTNIAQSIESHLIALAAEESRVTGKTIWMTRQ